VKFSTKGGGGGGDAGLANTPLRKT